MHKRSFRHNLRVSVLTGNPGWLAVRGRARAKGRPAHPGGRAAGHCPHGVVRSVDGTQQATQVAHEAGGLWHSGAMLAGPIVCDLRDAAAWLGAGPAEMAGPQAVRVEYDSVSNRAQQTSSPLYVCSYDAPVLEVTDPGQPDPERLP